MSECGVKVRWRQKQKQRATVKEGFSGIWKARRANGGNDSYEGYALSS